MNWWFVTEDENGVVRTGPANEFWKRLAEEKGFDYRTVAYSGKGMNFFTAVKLP
jgi:hypothetical protein